MTENKPNPAFIAVHFAKLPLTQRMRLAADVLEEAVGRYGGDPFYSVWSQRHLRTLADQWEREDADKADREKLVEELARDMFHGFHNHPDIVWGTAPSSKDWREMARKLIDAGWTKVTGDE